MNCHICNSTTVSLGTVPFDRNNAKVTIVNDTPMEYVKCTNCNAVSCPEMLSWTAKALGEKVYNEEYINYDPDYTGVRPKNYAKMLLDITEPSNIRKIKHLDYGSGLGIMSEELIKKKWNSSHYDPYSSPDKPEGTYNFITAIEVFEHALDIDSTILDIKSFLENRSGVILFSTQFADANTDIGWWYIGARNGHINILSNESMKILAIRHGLFFSSLNSGIHLLQSTRNNYRELIGKISPW